MGHRRAGMKASPAGRLNSEHGGFRPARLGASRERTFQWTRPEGQLINHWSPRSSAVTSKKNQLSPADMPALINTVYQSLLALGKPPEPEPRNPAVPIRRSVTRNYVVPPYPVEA